MTWEKVWALHLIKKHRCKNPWKIMEAFAKTSRRHNKVLDYLITCTGSQNSSRLYLPRVLDSGLAALISPLPPPVYFSFLRNTRLACNRSKFSLLLLCPPLPFQMDGFALIYVNPVSNLAFMHQCWLIWYWSDTHARLFHSVFARSGVVCQPLALA